MNCESHIKQSSKTMLRTCLAILATTTTVLSGGLDSGEDSLSLLERIERLEERVRGQEETITRLLSTAYCYTCAYQADWSSRGERSQHVADMILRQASFNSPQ